MRTLHSRVTGIANVQGHRLRTICFAVVCATLTQAFAQPAEAQLGKLKKMGADKVKDAAKEAAGVKTPEPPPGSTAARVDYAITEERLSGIMGYLTPLVAEAQKAADEQAAIKAYTTSMEAASACYNKLSEGDILPDMSAMMNPRAQALSDKIAAYGTRVDKANVTKNYRVVVATTDSMMVAQMQYSAMMFPSAKCAPIPYKSSALVSLEATRLEQMASGTIPASQDGNKPVPAAMRAGMTTGQFGRIRERMAIWLLVQSGDLPADSFTFTDEEQSLLKAKSAALKQYGPLFKQGVMRWATWGDITGW